MVVLDPVTENLLENGTSRPPLISTTPAIALVSVQVQLVEVPVEPTVLRHGTGPEHRRSQTPPLKPWAQVLRFRPEITKSAMTLELV